MAPADGADAAVGELLRVLDLEERVRALLPPGTVTAREGTTLLAIVADVPAAVELALAAGRLGEVAHGHHHPALAVGVAAGAVVVGEQGDVHGPPASRARRLVAIGGPGDVWVAPEVGLGDLPAGVGVHGGNAHMARLIGFEHRELRDYRSAVP